MRKEGSGKREKTHEKKFFGRPSTARYRAFPTPCEVFWGNGNGERGNGELLNLFALDAAENVVLKRLGAAEESVLRLCHCSARC